VFARSVGVPASSVPFHVSDDLDLISRATHLDVDIAELPMVFDEQMDERQCAVDEIGRR
jgi:hypothetical protein